MPARKTTKTSAIKPTPPREPNADRPETDDSPDAPTHAKFTGFADSQLAFFHALAKHQDREWFAAHKSDYLEGWHAPMESLLHEVFARIDEQFPYVELAAPKVFRIYKDVRFAKDKSPYKTHVAGIILARQHGGTTITEYPAALYISVGVGDDGNMTAHGQYNMAPAQLEKFRAAIVDDQRGTELAKICKSLEKAGFRFASGDSLKNVPRGFDPEHPRAELLKRKGLVAMGPEMPTELLTSPTLVDYLAKQTLKAASLVNWLVEATAISTVTGKIP
jgi:uncharacterized protein (TIGR02453 family)